MALNRATLLPAALLATLCLLASCSASRLTDAEKARKEAADSATHARAVELATAGQFLVTATQVSFNRGPVLQCTPNTNFLWLCGNRAMVQIAPRIAGGPNGVGGITFEGDVSNYKARVNGRGAVSVTFNITYAGRMADITLSIPASSTRVTVRAKTTFARWACELYGSIHDFDPSQVIGGALSR